MLITVKRIYKISILSNLVFLLKLIKKRDREERREEERRREKKKARFYQDINIKMHFYIETVSKTVLTLFIFGF